MISVDGSLGEGGGQILRSALALSMVTGRAFRIVNIRAGRARPGLLRQHLTCVRAACAVSGGEAAGAELGSGELTFVPGAVRSGDYSFSIGTAGSTTLVLQTVLPALMTAGGASAVELCGGTHNTHAPSVHFLQHAFLPVLERMGPRVRVVLERHGFYPAGGGRVRVEIEPAGRLRPIELHEGGAVTARRAVATVAGLPWSVGRRELDVVAERLGWGEESLRLERVSDDAGPGNTLSVEVRRGGVTEVFTGFGERGVSAERVAGRTVGEVRRYLAADVPVWRHLADQLMLPMALARGGSFTTGALTEHARTNAAVIESFLDVRVHHSGDERCRVVVHA